MRFGSIFVVVGILVALSFIPALFRKTEFKIESASSPDKKSDLSNKFEVVLGPRGPVSLSELLRNSKRGLIVNLWATWCAPCLEELPSLEYLNRQLEKDASGKFPKIITISVDASDQEVKGLFRTLPFTPSFVVLLDPLGGFSQTLGTTRYPETYWFSKSGEKIHKWVGPQNWLSKDVLAVLEKKSGEMHD